MADKQNSAVNQFISLIWYVGIKNIKKSTEKKIYRLIFDAVIKLKLRFRLGCGKASKVA